MTDQLGSQADRYEWELFVEQTRQGTLGRHAVPEPPRLIASFLNRADVLDGSYGFAQPTKETPQPVNSRELLEYYYTYGFLGSIPPAHEAARELVLGRCKLVESASIPALNDCAELCAHMFDSPVIITVVAGERLVVLGSGQPEGAPDADWQDLANQHCMWQTACRANTVLPKNPDATNILIYENIEHDWRVCRNPDFRSPGLDLSLMVLAPITIPDDNEDEVAIGSLCVVRTGEHVPWTERESVLLAKYAARVRTELISFDTRTRLLPKHRQQTQFIGSFIQDDLGSDSPSLRAHATYEPSSGSLSHVSPAHAAVLDVQQEGENAQAHAFDKTMLRVGQLIEANAVALLDLREFAKSASIRLDSIKRGLGRKPASSRQLDQVHSETTPTEDTQGEGQTPMQFVQDLRPIKLLGVMPGQISDALQTLLSDQAFLQPVEAALKTTRVHSTTSGLESAFSIAIPPSYQSSVVLPIFDFAGHPALVIVATSTRRGTFGREDVNFLSQVGHLCLTACVKDAALAGERSKLAFVAQISHELRTPMHGLAGQVETIRDMFTGTEESARLDPVLRVADVCLESLSSIMDDSLVFAKLSNEAQNALTAVSGDREKLDFVDLAEFIRNVIKATWVRKMRLTSASGSSAGKQMELAEDGVEVIMDFRPQQHGWGALINQGEVRRVVSNIVSNSYTFTQEGWVRVTVDTESEVDGQGRRVLTIAVSDSGTGIPPAFLASGDIWLPFRQADSFSPGSGLGLSIVRELLNSMGGAVNITSLLGEGTNVFVSLPLEFQAGLAAPHELVVFSDEMGLLKQVAKRRIQVRKGHHTFGGHAASSRNRRAAGCDSDTTTNIRPWTLPPNPLSANEAVVDLPPASSRIFSPLLPNTFDLAGKRPLRVLVAEDNQVSRNILTRLIAKHGFLCHSVGDGQKAVDVFRTHGNEFDITLMDIQMPIKDGIEASFDIRKIEQQNGWRRHRIVALTGLSSSEDISLALDSNGPMDVWIVKGGASLRIVTQELQRMQSTLNSHEGELPMFASGGDQVNNALALLAPLQL